MASLQARLAAALVRRVNLFKNYESDLGRQRARLDLLGSLYPPRPGVSISHTRINGIQGEWLIPPDAPEP
jgi:hypothetical protein